MHLVVSIHDVSPLTQQVCERQVAALAALGVERASLLVIPDHHGRGHFMADPRFVRWLRGLAAAGHEVVVHGYRHRRPRRLGETWRDRFLTQLYTSDEGEFYDLSYDTALSLCSAALSEFVAAGFAPTGFVAPAWLLGREAQRAVSDVGFNYTTRLKTVLDLRGGREFAAQSLCWSTRSAWRRVVSHAWNARLFHRLENDALLRVAVHPGDVMHAKVWTQIERLVSAALARREATTYQAWLDAI